MSFVYLSLYETWDWCSWRSKEVAQRIFNICMPIRVREITVNFQLKQQNEDGASDKIVFCSVAFAV